ncbi:MAG: ABC transporter permease [Clostridiales bacterium]|nr:ABC transporter permease [Clostridiales bacterium]
MKTAYILLRWELRKVFSNWRQTVSVFLLPSLVLIIALYAFPILVNFLSSGSIGRGAVTLVNPDETFINYIENDSPGSVLEYKTISEQDFSVLLNNGAAAKETKSGGIVVVFSALPYENSSDSPSFSDAVKQYYVRLSEGDTNAGSTAFISIYYDRRNASSFSNFMLFETAINDGYDEYLLENLGEEYYSLGGGDAFDVNRINPYTTLMDLRNVANRSAAAVIPGILLLLAYYCVYSLAADTLAAERERGFLSKIALTPIGTSALLAGKAIAVTLVSSLSTMATLFVLILSSWFNFSNDPLSLLPFGLILFPREMLPVIVTILTVTLMLTLFCFVVTLSLRKTRDVMLNLQIPLILFLGEFFAHLFRYSAPVWGEYFIPAHNSLIIIRDTLSGTLSTFRFLLVTFINLSLSAAMFLYAKRHFNPTAAGITEKGKNYD